MSTTATITSLAALSGVATDDVLPIVDVSDTTQAPSGSTKKVPVATLLTGYLTTATAASTYLPLSGGTLTGALTISMGGTSSATSVALVNGSAMLLHGSTIGFQVDNTYDIGSSIASGRPRNIYLGGTLTAVGLALSGALAHTGTTAGFFGTTARTRPSVSGSKTGADALALALLNALGDVVGVGLVHDATT